MVRPGQGARNRPADVGGVPHAGPVPLPVRARAAAALVLVSTTLLAGCSDADDCAGQTYDADLDQAGAASPILALQDWLSTHEGFDEEPPLDENWVVRDTGEQDAEEVVITHEDGDGWWVQAARTSGGGYVVVQATSDFSACEDELAG